MRRQPMSKLERESLFPTYKDVPASWRRSIEKPHTDVNGEPLKDEFGIETGENDWCPECGRLRGPFAGVLDEKCICDVPERDSSRKIHYPYMPVPSFEEIAAK